MKQAQLNKIRAQWHSKYDSVSKSSKKYVKFGAFKTKYIERQAYDKARYQELKKAYDTYKEKPNADMNFKDFSKFRTEQLRESYKLYKAEHETNISYKEFREYQQRYEQNKEAYRQEQMNYRLSLNQKVDAIYEMWGDENGIDVNDSPRGAREKETRDEVLLYIEKVVNEHPDMPEEQIFSLYVSGRYRIND